LGSGLSALDFSICGILLEHHAALEKLVLRPRAHFVAGQNFLSGGNLPLAFSCSAGAACEQTSSERDQHGFH
jgi:hypothetical protein